MITKLHIFIIFIEGYIKLNIAYECLKIKEKLFSRIQSWFSSNSNQVTDIFILRMARIHIFQRCVNILVKVIKY